MTARRAATDRGTLLLAAALLSAAACESGPRPATDGSAVDDSADFGGAVADSTFTSAVAPPRVSLVDTAIAPAVAGENGWMYSQAVEADLDGDGAVERVVLTARAEVMNGRPLWDDGQPWQVYVEEPDGERTYLFARFVQLGTVTMRIGLAGGEGPATVVLLEHLPDRLALYEIVYRGPAAVETIQRFQRSLDPTGDVASPALP